MNKNPKRKVGRPARYRGKRSSIAARLQEPLYDRIKGIADETGYSLSEVIERLIETSFRLQDERPQMLAQLNAMGREQAMAVLGLKPMPGRANLFYSGDGPPEEWIVLNPALETLVERVASRAAELALRGTKK